MDIDTLLKKRAELLQEINDLEISAWSAVPDLIREIEDKFNIKIYKEGYSSGQYHFAWKLAVVPYVSDGLIEAAKLIDKFQKLGYQFLIDKLPRLPGDELREKY